MELDEKAPRLQAPQLEWERLLDPLNKAADRIARLDERLRTSSLAEGWRSRTDFREAQAALWVDGVLVSVEDLVLRDAGMDIRAPTPELSRAMVAYGLRRKIWRSSKDWANSEEGRSAILGHLDGASRPREVDDWFVPKADHADRLTEWTEFVRKIEGLSPLIRAALALDLWKRTEPSERSPWAGAMMVGAQIRAAGATTSFLPLINIGLRESQFNLRRNRESSATDRAIWILESFAVGADYGLAEHDRMALARETLGTKLKDRRTSSRMPDFVDLVLSLPIVTVPLVAAKLKVSPQAAQVLIDECGSLLREVTGRRRYRAWSIGV
ncbi:DUF1612 domain-containing protein [Bosea sp. RAC05]|uniref:DUF1612 domain-containing protein n=1 Tax=Bosea sp. RAC05 TaxID=1842539 RepID=UPI00083D195D|nr:DUF1612 domain-containing protein [Bosea sp. RAC05]AOG02910.1 HTH DNA binding domain protein [Bosea sp. RAC05]